MTLPDAVDEPDLWVRLPWDSNHFGFPIGRILPTSISSAGLLRAVGAADAAGVRCLYWLSDPDDSRVAYGERAGFNVVDVRVELVAHLGSPKMNRLEATKIREAGELDLVPLKALASTSHRNTRFYRDRSFPTDRADELYERWIEKSFQDPKQEVLVSGAVGRPSGYIAFGVSDDGHGVIGLIAVDESHRGTGLGSALVSVAMGRLAQRGIDHVTVITQGDNQPADRLYTALGFSERSRFVWLHRWFEA